MKRSYIAFGLLLCFLGGCASQNLYYWGRYELSVYDRLAKNNEEGPVKHIEWLQEDIAYSDKKGLQLPPGFHAHLAMLYSEVGNGGLAQEHLAKEKQLYPESTTMISMFQGKNKAAKRKKK